MTVRRAKHYTTGAQEWHIVSLLGDVTSPTTVAHYVSMTSHLRVLSTEALTTAPTVDGVHIQAKGEVHSLPLN